jgi:hypothetical protein
MDKRIQIRSLSFTLLVIGSTERAGGEIRRVIRDGAYLAATSRWTGKLLAGDMFRTLYQGAFVRCRTCLAKAVDLAVIAHGDTVLMNVILMLNFVDVPSLIADAQ